VRPRVARGQAGHRLGQDPPSPSPGRIDPLTPLTGRLETSA
jgi:hypothetical protein